MKKNIILLSIFLCLLVSCKSLPFAKKQAPAEAEARKGKGTYWFWFLPARPFS